MNYSVYLDLIACHQEKSLRSGAKKRGTIESTISRRLILEEKNYDIIFYDRKKKCLTEAGFCYIAYGSRIEAEGIRLIRELYRISGNKKYNCQGKQTELILLDGEKEVPVYTGLMDPELVGILEGLIRFKDFSYTTAVVQYQSLLAAAEALFVSQPALTQYLAKFTENLGLNIFSTERRSYELTEAGKIYIEIAERALQLENDLLIETENLLRKARRRLSICVNRQTGSKFLAETLPHFIKEFPDVMIDIKEGDSDKAREMVLEGLVDVSILNSVTLNGGKLRYEYIFENELRIIMPLSYKERFPDCIKMEWLANESFIMYQEFTFMQHFINAVLLKKKFFPKIICRINLFTAVQSLVASGVGIAFIPASVLAPDEKRFHICYLTPEERFNVVAAVHEKMTMEPYIVRLIEILKEYAPEI